MTVGVLSMTVLNQREIGDVRNTGSLQRSSLPCCRGYDQVRLSLSKPLLIFLLRLVEMSRGPAGTPVV
jgi:hypothetical protein